MFVVTWLVPNETAVVSAHVPCTPYNHAPGHSASLCKDIIYEQDACVFSINQLTSALFLRAAAVTRVWNAYRDKGQHRKLTLEKTFLPPFLPGLEPATFRSGVWRRLPLIYPRPSK